MELGASFHHVAISVADLDRSTRFYQQLGFEEFIRWPSVKGGLMLCHMRLGGVILELFCYETPESAPASAAELDTDLRRIGVKHFGLRVASVDDARTFVLERGLADEVKITRGSTGLSYFFIRDPDGTLCELIEDKRGI